MPVINADGCPIHVEVEGPERAPVLMLSNSLGTTLQMWDGQVAPFTQHFRLVRYDRRGHGKSGVPQGALHHGTSRPRRACRARRSSASRRRTGAGFPWAAWSASGSAPTRPTGSSGSCSPTRRATFPTRLRGTTASRLVREKGVAGVRRAQHGALVHQGLPRTLAAAGSPDAGDVRRDPARRLPRLRRGGARHGPPRPAAEDQGADPGHRRQTRSRDAARGERIYQEPYPGRAVHHARRRAHFQRRAARRLHRRRCWNFCWRGNVRRKTRSKTMDDKERHRRGEDARRKILGDAWVDRADATRLPSMPNGRISLPAVPGARSGRGRISRSARGAILVIGTMMAIGRWEEFRMHVRAALVEGGFSADDIKEIILQQANYCGVPVGNHAFRRPPRCSRRLERASGVDLTFATHLAASSRSECQIQNSTN